MRSGVCRFSKHCRLASELRVDNIKLAPFIRDTLDHLESGIVLLFQRLDETNNTPFDLLDFFLLNRWEGKQRIGT